MYIRAWTACTIWCAAPAGCYHRRVPPEQVEQSTYNFEYADVDFLFSASSSTRKKPNRAGAGKTAAAAGL